MNQTPENKLFTPSGCFSAEGLSLFSNGLLSAEEMVMAEAHLKSCELCRLAVEGFQTSNPADFEADLNELLAGFEMSPKPVSGEMVLPHAAAFEGPRFPRLSQEEIRQFSREILQKSEKAAAALAAPDNTETPKGNPFYKKHYASLIAAAVMLLLAIGGWQLYTGLVKQKEESFVAQGDAVSKTEAETIVPDAPLELFPQEKATVVEKEPAGVQKQQQPVIVEDKEPAVVVENDFMVEMPEPEIVTRKAEPLPPSAQGAAVNVEESSSVPQARLEAVNTGLKKENRKATALEEAEMEEVAEERLFTVVEVMPEFPGGQEALQKFLAENLKYPEEGLKSSSSGTVYVSFVVDTNGKIINPVILRGIGKAFDDEVLRVIGLMPKWKPGLQRSKPVRVRMNLPVKFSTAG
jgi:protein TonB